MPDILTAQLATEFASPSLDHERFSISGSLINTAIPAAESVNADVETFGRVRFETFNPTPAKRGRFEYPRMAWKLRNPDGKYTPGHANEIWQGYEPQAWVAQYSMSYTQNDGATVALLSFAFDVLDVQLEEEEATIVSIHQLARAWARRWDREDRHPTTWNTTHGAIL